MRKTLVLGLAAVALAAGAAPSQARFRLRTSHHASAVVPAAAPLRPTRIAVAGATAPLGLRTAEAHPRDAADALAAPRAPEAVAVPPLRREAAPWCPTGQVAGSGAGFCLIN